jgi:serine phosphatase RsbU (regulator of sigma subunit)/anti-sigma regulatory factor (Ser/Thr protein kinase)
VAILLVDDDGKTLKARAAKGLEEEVERGFSLPIGMGFAGRVAGTRSPVVIPDLEDSPIEVVNPLMREKGVRSLLGVPLVVEGRVIGVLHVGSLTLRNFTEDDARLLQLVGDRIAVSIEHASFATQHRIAKTLQRALLPQKLPMLPGLGIAARYLPAAAETEVGGDWYDVIELDHRSIGVAIGDVAGKGLRAAAFMGQLRSALRASALEGDPPGEVLTRVARFAELGDAPMATMLYGTLNLETLELVYARAGHPYPLLLRGNGSSEYLIDEGNIPLGAGRIAEYSEHRVRLHSGETLLLYTDGLIERRGERLSEGEARLAEVLASAPAKLEVKCSSVIERMTGGAQRNDDIALLAVQPVDLAGALDLSVPARPKELSRLRHLLRRWLADRGATDDDCSAFAIAATEALANAIEHAYGPGDATIDVRIDQVADVITVTVSDNGSWREPQHTNRGQGIMLMRKFMDDVEIAKLEGGTVVQLRRAVGAGPNG